MFGLHWLGRHSFRWPLIASALYLLIVVFACGTIVLLGSRGGSFVVGIQNLTFGIIVVPTFPWMWALEPLGLVARGYWTVPTNLGFVLAHTLNAILVFAIGSLIVKFAKK